ncbi:MAG: SDR family oxidoreductase [Gammaproteobacteria bacterium]|nr:SDR family oxidoreductase [Gammaproteobacteria bacterium]NIR82082.1 SDR family oxidoreductase [Gammaproteobacteria bacterium]NIR89315.1 SDR family oxidoreductase [Gammaproteobacteria bacterium]NIU03192.1 SDR family oxidoreductase [Gammaproteobacteria bacterium]NIV50704.1 NAD-dependent epimerase/dehydratase family protein [Gammaproteobacteria bacterium]
MRILIAGCGDVGTALGLRLTAEGHEVFGLRRRSEALPEPLHRLRGDLTEPATLAALPARLDVVVYSAAAGAFDEAAYEAVYVRGLSHLVDALHREGQRPRRLLYVSSTGVYGQSDGSWVDEDSDTEPAHFSGRCLLAGEARALDAGIPGCVVRFGGIYGPGRTRLMQRVREGARCIDQPPVWTNRIHRDDCAGVLRHLAGRETVAPVYLAVDCEPSPECAVMDWIAERLGRPHPPRVSAQSAGSGRRRANKRCRNARLLASGYRFRYPTFREGYAQVLAYNQDQKVN